MCNFLKLQRRDIYTTIPTFCHRLCCCTVFKTFKYICYYGGGCGEARSGETSKWSSLNSCAGLLSRKSWSWGGVYSGDSAGSTIGFLLSCGSFRNLMDGREEAIKINVCVAVGIKHEENDKEVETETWKGVFVLAPSWWCSACSSAAKHGTFSHRSYCLGSVKRYHTSSGSDSTIFTLVSCSPVFVPPRPCSLLTELEAHLVVSPETCQSVRVNHPEHQAALVFPSDVFLVAVVTQ